MSQSTSEIRTQVASLIEQAIALGPRKELRSTLVRALEIAKGDAPKELTQLHYDRLGRGARRFYGPRRRGWFALARLSRRVQRRGMDWYNW